MAQRIKQVRVINFNAIAALGFILGAVALGIAPLLWLGFANGFGGFDDYLLSVIGFTLWQGFLSTALSIILAVPVAIALARRTFYGRGVLLAILSVPLALPTIVAILGILSVYGNQGFLASPFSIYGLSGIVFAHVFFNFPLAVRLFLTRLQSIPDESFRLAEQLGFNDWQIFRLIAWPQISSALIGVASLIFLLCMASFAVVLILGGGPQATTLEVAIYQSLRLDFDPALAAILALVQMFLCGVTLVIAGQFARDINVFPQLIARRKRRDGASLATQAMDAISISVAIAIVVPPIAAVIAAGPLHLQLNVGLLQALFTSIGIGLASAILSLLLGWTLAHAAAKTKSKILRSGFGIACLAALVLPPAVLATGWFLVLAPITDVRHYAILMIIVLNALMALPFIWAAMAPAIVESLQRHDRLCESLAITGFARLWIVDLPDLQRPLALAFGMATIVSLGDISAVTFFGDATLVTLPALIMKQMGHYRMMEAAGTALVLTALCFAILTLVQRWNREND